MIRLDPGLHPPDYERWLDRSPAHIRVLLEDGGTQPAAFFAQRREALAAR